MVDYLNLTSILLEPCFNGTHLGFATGFIVKDGEHIYLATNRHVVTGKNPITDKNFLINGALPDSLIVWNHKKSPPSEKAFRLFFG